MFLSAFWRGKNVLLTGHTGFKGAWMAFWLKRLGAHVTGLALPPDTDPNLYTILGPDLVEREYLLDVRDRDTVHKAIQEIKPDIVLHLAAQPLVRRSYREPVDTFATNVMGTLHLLEAIDKAASASIVLVVTSDKVYLNRDDGHPFREDDPLGGDDPYSASKGAAEIAVAGWRKSFWNQSGPVLATARAGNIIGGGDWSEDRLIPDYVRAVQADIPFTLRNPHATRPWQHVLEASYGYLLYIQRLAENPPMGRTLNFGPKAQACVSTHRVIEILSHSLPHMTPIKPPAEAGPPEKQHLTLNPELAGLALGWHTRLTIQDTVTWTGKWYAEWLLRHDMKAFSEAQLAHYESLISQ